MTLRDAVVAMRRASTHACTSEALDLMVQKRRNAELRLAKPEPHSSPIQLNVEAVDADTAALALIRDIGSQRGVVQPIRIDDSFEYDNPDVISAIVVYNFGCAYLCQSRATNAENATILRENAARVFGLSYSILTLCENEDNAWSTPRLLHVSIIVLRSLGEALSEAGQQGAAADCAARLCTITKAAIELDESPLIRGLVSSAAAAA